MSQLDLFGGPGESEPAAGQGQPLELTQLVPPGVELTPEERAGLLARVREPALVCTRCALAETRTQVVFGEGEASAPLMFIGEGPGENEDATGRPFVGRAGKLLDEALRENGMRREHVYIANVVKCRPTLFEGGKVRNRAPEADELAACNLWLRAQVEIIRPLVIVCLGAPSANVIIHKGFRITQERGQWFERTAYAPWALATFHPAYVLRQHGEAYGAMRSTLVSDIGAARRKVVDARRAAREGGAAAPGGPDQSLF